MRHLAILLVGFFALALQLLAPQRVSAFSEEMANQFDDCFTSNDVSSSGADRDTEMEAVINCVAGLGFTYNEVVVLCTDDKYQDALSMEKCNAVLGKRTKTDPETNGEKQEGAVKPEDNKCASNNRAVAWFGCPVIDSASGTISAIYANVIEGWLVFDPTILTANGGSLADNGVYKVWSSIRGLANLLFVVLVLVVIFAQITGMQIQAYGIRKMLPKLAITALLVNVSYYICQVVTDLSNILGAGVGNFFIDISEMVDLTSVNGFSSVGGGATIFVSLIVVALGSVVAYLAMGPAFLIPVILAIVGVLITVFFIFVMLVVRQALMVLMIICAPIAIALSALPNTESVFKKWFNMFKGLLLTYPLASLLFYGGAFTARLILRVWDNSGLIVLIVALGVSVVPITMLPQITKSSVAAIDGLLMRAQNGLSRFTKNRVMDTRFADNAERVKKEKAQRRAAGTYLDKKTGELKSFVPKGIRKVAPNFDYNLAGAMKTASSERHAQFLKDNPGMVDQMAMDSRVKAAEMELDSGGVSTVNDLAKKLSDAYDSGDVGMVNAATKRLFDSGEAGRARLSEEMKSKQVNAAVPNSVRSMEAVASAIAGFGDAGKDFDLEMMSYAKEVVTNGAAATGSFATYTPPDSLYENVSGEKIDNMDLHALKNMQKRLPHLSASAANNVINSARRSLQSTDTAGVSSNKRRVIDQIAKFNT